MNKILEYPRDNQLILRKKKSIRKMLLENENMVEKKIAILGGSTTEEIKNILELLLLNNSIKPSFYESEYAQYWQDSVFENEKLREFAPDFIFIHTSNKNIQQYPNVNDNAEDIENILNKQFEHFSIMWDKLRETYKCPIIQNNFEFLNFRLLGNSDVSDVHGRVNYITKLNIMFSDYANKNDNFFINDINYQSACFGLDKWSDQFYWYMYKYSLHIEAIPDLAFNVSNIIKSLCGKNKKAIAVDLDNTLWGGIIGDDGVGNIEIGQETSIGQAYYEFQLYLKSLQEQGIILNVISKNDYDNAISGIDHPYMILKREDFTSIKANWEPKSKNLLEIADELTLMIESFVFCDDNPAEREIIAQQTSGVSVVKLDKPEHYILAMDRGGFFEVTNLSSEDLNRNDMYKENIKRSRLMRSLESYEEYLNSLEMKAEIKPFDSIHVSRIAQLTNKSNQFNLTTKRYTNDQIEELMLDENHIALYGKLEDKFGDNGIVSLVIGKIEGDKVDIILWLMSCRVLKRDMEFAMFDSLVEACMKRGITRLNGYYYPSGKNKMVEDFYDKLNFQQVEELETSFKRWEYDLSKYHHKKNKVINVN